MEANRANQQQIITRSNKNQDKCIVNLSIATVVLCTITMVTVVTLHWMWLSSHPSTEFHTVLLTSVMILYTVTTINSLVIILKVDKRKNQSQIVSEQIVSPIDSSNSNDFQRSIVDRISLPNLHVSRFEDFTPSHNYAQTTVHRSCPRMARSKSEKAICKARTGTSTSSGEDGSNNSSRYESEGYEMSELRAANHSFEMNLHAPQHQRLTRLSGTTTTTTTSTKYVPGISQEQRTSSQVEPIYENVMFPGKLPTNTGLNLFDSHKPKCEKLNVTKMLKSNVDFEELNNGQQLATVRKSPNRNSSFQMSIAQKIYSKHTTEARHGELHSYSSNAPPSILITSTSGVTRPFISSETIYASSSETSPNRDYVNTNSSTASPRSRNRPIPSESSSNPVVSRGSRPFISTTTNYASSSESRHGALHSYSSNAPPSILITSASGVTRPFISSETIYASSSETSPNREYVNGNSSPALPRSKNRPSASNSNLYSSSEKHKLCSKVTTFSSGSPKTSAVYNVPPVRRMVCSSSMRVAPSYSEGALNAAFLQTENSQSATLSYESEPTIFEEHCRSKYLPEKMEPDQKSIQKTKIFKM